MHDFTVIGAGPAGLSAAIELSKGGANTLVIDRKREIGRPLQCGETIRMSSLVALGMEKGPWVDNVLSGYRMVMPNGNYVLMKERMAMLSRETFERELESRAVASGTNILMSTGVYSIKRKEGHYRIFTSGGNFDTRYIIGADGPKSMTGEYLDAYESRDFVVSTVNRVRRPKGMDPEYESIFFSPKYPHGYGYIFPRSDGTDNAGVAIKVGSAPMKELNQSFLRAHGYSDIGYSGGGLIPLNFRLRYHAKEGIMLVGDAAGLPNSVDYGGIYAAVASGRLAGQTGLKHMSDKGKEPFPEYDRMLRKQPYFQRKREKDHDIVYSSGEEVLNLAGELAHGRSMEEIGMMEGLSFLRRKKALGHAFRLLAMRSYAIRVSKSD